MGPGHNIILELRRLCHAISPDWRPSNCSLRLAMAGSDWTRICFGTNRFQHRGRSLDVPGIFGSDCVLVHMERKLSRSYADKMFCRVGRVPGCRSTATGPVDSGTELYQFYSLADPA